jgi:Xaa-Pro dipeptidase
VNLQDLARLYIAHVAHLQSKYEEALGAAGYDAIVIHSGSPKKRTEFDDQYWPLRATPHFQHWLPLDEPECALVVVAGKKPKLVWLRDGSFWEKPAAPETDHWLERFDIVHVKTPEEAKTHLPTKRAAFLGEERARGSGWGFADADVNPTGLALKLDQLRVTKTAYEIMCLAEANRRAARGHDAVAHGFRAGDASELELHLLYLRATAQDDPETPYKNIVALGANAATLHHIKYGRKSPGSPGAQALLLDAGATFQGYCSDITRTFVKGAGAAVSAFGSLVDGVERFQKKLCTDVAVGNKYEALHEEAHRQVGATLREAGVTKLSVDEAVSGGVTRAFFPHGLGHSLGLQCHDVGCALVKPKPDNPFLRNTTTIALGQVFTIEPGIYFIDALLAPLKEGPHAAAIDWTLVAELAKMGGVRIEDDVVVTGPAGVRNLTREFLP